ncbi:polyisoprenoid-binding protein [Pigmentiphaga aceris]|uniref:Polyisoprenoid-binding protein n=1 Tax=Pigmentiphaga aceris TaxID=1940612 RepID=A0A5C0B0I6_9BURK|nr:YceI family protein [Pigmentiphaga aceris]QEI06147.1 polyisoprenoid-binding protein [Pigmentiphaga aceris]
MKQFLIALAFLSPAGVALAAPVHYDIDPDHTYPSFAADHMGGLSTWRGKFTKTAGTIMLDRAAKTGSVDITVDTTSIDFGHAEMNKHAKAADMFNVAKFPTATYRGKITEFKGDVPSKVEGDFTLMGVTKPLVLTINSFKCMENPMTKAPTCGADATGNFNRGDFGLNFALNMGFKPEVALNIQIEATQKK